MLSLYRGPMRYRLSVIILLGLVPFIRTVAQDLPAPDPEVVHPNVRVSISNMPVVKISDQSSVAVAKAAVAMVLGATKVNCDPASQLNTILEANAEARLQTVAAKLSGASCMANGRIVHLSASFTPSESIQSDGIIAPLLHGKPLLIRWNDALYVLYGVIYDEHVHNSGKRDNVIRRLLLLDPRYADERRFVSFDREKDDFAQVEGFAEISTVVP